MRKLSMPGLPRMAARDPREQHRVASSLELFFDLVFVIAVSQASQALHHELTTGDPGHAVLAYAIVFFAIWWAWMNFTWFASAFDTDDWLYRITTIVQMGGVLLLAAGVAEAMLGGQWSTVTWGYVIMRLAMVSQWVRVAISDPTQRAAALRYAGGIAAVQGVWLLRLLLPAEGQFWTFWVAAGLELLVPVWAERGRETPWHPRHIAERFSLFVLILLGESLLASANAIFGAAGGGARTTQIVMLSVAALVLAAGVWWIYFSTQSVKLLRDRRSGFVFGYAHFFLFAAVGALSAGIETELDLLTGTVAASQSILVSFALAIPVGMYMLVAWLILLRRSLPPLGSVLFLLCAAVALSSGVLPSATVLACAVAIALAVAVLERLRRDDGADERRGVDAFGLPREY